MYPNISDLKYTDHIIKVFEEHYVNIYKCNRCCYFSKFTSSIENHSKRHDSKFRQLSCEEAVVENYSCQECQISTPLLVDFKRHAKNTKLDIERHCKHCTFQTSSRLLFIHHKSKCTRNDEWFQCDLCDHKTKYKGHLRRHKVRRHNHKYKPLSCDKCHYKAKNEEKLKNHIYYTHTDAKWFECGKCHFKSNNKQDVQKHIDTKHNNRNQSVKYYHCEKCPAKYKGRSGLFYHNKEKHTENKEITWFDCPECDLKTKSKNNLQKHIKIIHRGDKWFECGICHHKTKRKASLNRHFLAKHTNPDEIKWFNCDNCTFKSKFHNELNRHNRIKHNIHQKVD